MKNPGPTSLSPYWPLRFGQIRLLSSGPGPPWAFGWEMPNTVVILWKDTLFKKNWLLLLGSKTFEVFWVYCKKPKFVDLFYSSFYQISILQFHPVSQITPRVPDYHSTVTMFWTFMYSSSTYLPQAHIGPGIVLGVGENSDRCVLHLHGGQKGGVQRHGKAGLL